MKPDDSILENPETQIEYWLSLRQIPRSQIEEQFDIDPETVIRTSYSWEAELELLRNRTTHTGQFYFRDHTFILYTITSSSELRKISGTQLIRALGEPTAILPSRVGKRFKVYIYPEKGIAISAEKDTLRLIEIFPSMSLEAYRASFYQEPPTYIR